MMSDSLTTIYLTHINLVRWQMLFSLFNILRPEPPVRVHSDMSFVAGFGQVTNVVSCKAHSEVVLLT